MISHICLVIVFSLFFLLLQACTGIDNIAEAITLLELNNWDLVVSLLFAGFGFALLTGRVCPTTVEVHRAVH